MAYKNDCSPLLCFQVIPLWLNLFKHSCICQTSVTSVDFFMQFDRNYRNVYKSGRHITYDSKWAYNAPLVKLLFNSLPEPKGQLTWSLVVSNGVNCRSKVAKIIQIRNPRWPPWWPFWKFIFGFLSWTKRLVDLKIGKKYQAWRLNQLK